MAPLDENARGARSDGGRSKKKNGPIVAGATAPGNFSEPFLVSANDAAARLGISKRLLQSLTTTGAIGSVKLRRRRLYRLAALEAWVAIGCPTEPGTGKGARP